MTPENATLYVTDRIINAASASIPQTSENLPKRCKPWWTKDCSVALKRQNRAWGTFCRYPTVWNKIEFKKCKAKARWTRKRAKKSSWMKYVSKVNSFDTTKEVWDRMRKIRGNYLSFRTPLFPSASPTLKGQANVLAEHFCKVSNSYNYSAKFKKFKAVAEKQPIAMSGSDTLVYNQPFTMCELEVALGSKKQSAPGPDKIHYEMLRHLSPESLGHLLTFFNHLWMASAFPQCWKRAHIIPLLKPGKDSTLPASYRPIAMTSCLGKTYEKLINRRLVHFLETEGILDPNQCGFRMGRSTLDHLVRLETFIREAFVHRQHCVSVFLT